MPTVGSNTRSSKEAELTALRRAIAVERKALYADFQGKRSTFSQFMRHTADRLARRYPHDAVWVTVRALFRQYPNVDVGTRISIVSRVEELLIPFWDLVEENAKAGQPAETSGDSELRMSQEAQTETLEGTVEAKREAPRKVPKTPQVVQTPLTTPTTSSVATGFTARAPGENGPRNETGATTPAHRQNGPSPKQATNPAPKPDSSKPSPSGPDSKQPQNKLSHTGSAEQVNVQYVRGVGPKVAAILNRLEIFTVSDLLKHYPRRHLDFQNRLLIKNLEIGQEVSIFGTIRSVGAYQAKRGNVSILTILIGDGTGSVTITRFVGGKSNKYLLDRYKAQYPKGAQVLASGVVERDDYSNKFKLKNAEVEILGFLAGDGESDDPTDRSALAPESIHAGRLVPVYPLTEGLSLRYLRNIIHNALEGFGHTLEDPLPQSLKDSLGLVSLQDAIKWIHFPNTPEDKDASRRRLVFDELFAIQLQCAQRRYRFDTTEGALSLKVTEAGLVKAMRDVLPFKLTGAQERVFGEISRDLAAAKPMHRLVQGDVGSGKTVVALLAFLVAIENGYQGAMMAPTEILAEQHYRQFQKLLQPLAKRCALVLGKQGAKERRQVRQDILSGQAHIAVGTHALLEEDVEFANLGLIIIDEQHRFGVKQRARLKAKSLNPELLTMTATPIPRTLAMTMHGDLDVSEIDELPPGRKPVETKLLRPSGHKELWSFVRKEIEAGRQCYIVFPLIEESETLSAKAATQEYEKLRTTIFADFNIGLMHGKLKAQEKDEVMDRFRKGEFHILVSTTVIEVGVDVPNATVMVIENADRFGLAQLHQLRGRVGRGSDQSYCFLVSEQKTEATRERLEILTLTNDGFVVAEKDLEIRGPGEFLGYRQSGLPDLLLADLVKDATILEDARNSAIAIVKEDPELTKYPGLKKLLEQKRATAEAETMRTG